MRALANLILRGSPSAILVTAVAAVLSIALAPFSHLSGAALGLVTLRKGLRDAFIVLVGAGAVLFAVGQLSIAAGTATAVFLGAMVTGLWLPIIAAAYTLRVTRNMGASLLLVGALAGVAVLAFFVSLDDVAGWWRLVLHNLLVPLLEKSNVPMLASEIDAVITGMARVMTGIMAAVLIYTTMINLFIARWFQAIVYNPGGFRSEFLALRMGKRTAIGALVVVLSGALGSGVFGDLALNLALVVLTMYSLQGLALAHAIVAAGKAHNAWLIGTYVLMLFFLPHVMLVLSAAGFADSWVDFRARMRLSSPPQPGDGDSQDE